MKKFPIILIILLTLSINRAFAVTKNFEGLGASIGLAAVGISSICQYSIPNDPSFATENYHLGDIHFTGVINLSYLRVLNDEWLLGGGASYDPSPIKTAESNNNNSGLKDYSSNIRHHFSVYIQPTYVLSKETALFTKIGYHLAQINLIGQSDQTISGFQDYHNSVYGIGYSLGLITFLNKDIFIKTEIEFVDYKKFNTTYNDEGRLGYKLTTIAGIFSIGSRF
jgi:hypothetical protein